MGTVRADVKIESQPTSSEKTKKSSDSLYHARAGCGLFWALGRFRPTNYMILCQRPLNADLKTKNHNEDFIAPMFRDHLMPYRRLLYMLPFANRIYKFAIEDVVGAYGMINYVDARTAWMDDIVKQAQADGISQVVVLAAGYCTRAYRLKTSSTTFFEVDLPQVSEKKIALVDSVLPDKDKYPRPVYVGADLAMTPLAEALAAKGFDRTKPALFTCEGILCYLPQEAVDGLVAQISGLAAAGSRICFDALHRDYMDGTVKNRGYACGSKALKARGEPILSGFDTTTEGLSAYFKPHGWHIMELLSPKDMTEKRMSHLRWRERRPPMLAFESYALLQKVEPDQATVTAIPEPSASASAAEVKEQPTSKEAKPVLDAAEADTAAMPEQAAVEAAQAV